MASNHTFRIELYYNSKTTYNFFFPLSKIASWIVYTSPHPVSNSGAVFNFPSFYCQKKPFQNYIN